MPRKDPRSLDLAEDLDLLIEDIAAQWDFEKKPKGADLIKPGKVVRALHFAEAILIADGMEPKSEANWMRRIKRRFVARYGDDTVDPVKYG